MDESKRMIAIAKRSIHRHFNPPFLKTNSSRKPSFRSPRRFNNFRVIESIYSQEKALYESHHPPHLPRLKQKASREASKDRLMKQYRERKRQETSLDWTQHCKHLSGCAVDGYPNSLTHSWGQQLSLPDSPRPIRTAKVTNLIDQCKGVERSSALISTVRKLQTATQGFQLHLNSTQQTIQQLDSSPGDLLEPLFALRRESDAFILQDAHRYATEDFDTFNRINRMIERQRKRRQLSLEIQ